METPLRMYWSHLNKKRQGQRETTNGEQVGLYVEQLTGLVIPTFEWARMGGIAQRRVEAMGERKKWMTNKKTNVTVQGTKADGYEKEGRQVWNLGKTWEGINGKKFKGWKEYQVAGG